MNSIDLIKMQPFTAMCFPTLLKAGKQVRYCVFMNENEYVQKPRIYKSIIQLHN